MKTQKPTGSSLMSRNKGRKKKRSWSGDFLELTGVGVWVFDAAGETSFVNRAMAEMLGYSQEEMMALPATTFGEEAALAWARDYFRLCQQGVGENREFKLRHRDGSVVWALVSVTPVFDDQGGFQGAVATLMNITADKPAQEEHLATVFNSTPDALSINDIAGREGAEAELEKLREQLRALLARLQSVREEERRRIANEVHDEIGQLLTGLKLDLGWVERRIAKSSDEELRQKITPKMGEIAALLEMTIQTVRGIATALRPGALDELGLIAAIKWQANELSKRSGVEFQFDLCPEPAGLSPESATALFRVFQEALTNIARHAQARNVKVRLSAARGEITLTVSDDGVGITEEQIQDPKSLGLIGIRERALSLGGVAKISGKPGKGSTVSVRIPIE